MTDIGKAFSEPFKDPRWGIKFLLGMLAVLFCLTGVGAFVLMGYYIELTRRVMQGEHHPLPEWTDLGVKFIAGVKYFIVLMLYALPIIVLALPAVGLMIWAAVSGGELETFLAVVYLFGFVLLVIPYSIFLMLLGPILAYRFAARESISDALDVAAAVRTLGRRWESTLVVALLCMGLEWVAGLGIFLFLVGIFATMFYVYLVTAFLHGLLYREHYRRTLTAPLPGESLASVTL